MSFRRFPLVAVLAAGLFGVTATACTQGAQPAAESARASAVAVSEESSYNDVDTEFVEMMVPHHHQALIMADLVPERSSDEQVASLASRIDVEQGLEITMMRGWQGRNDLPKTDPEKAYQELLGMPDMLEHMGMATPEDLETLRGLSGEEFDVKFLTLMIRHHEGAIDMLRDVLLNGTDQELHTQSEDMMSTQRAQVDIMRQLLEGKTS